MAELRLDLSKIDKDLESQYDDPDDLHDDEEGVEDIDPLIDDLSPDDRLSPLDKLHKYYQSDDVGERDVALRIIPDVIQSLTAFTDFDLLLDVVFTLATDYEPCIRINVLANLSPLLDKNTSLTGEGEEFAPENEERLFSIPVKMLVDINLQVRRASQNCIVNLLEEERGTKGSLLSQLYPMIKRCLGRDENYDLRMDTVLMLGRVAGIFGREVLVDNFVPLLPSLALDTMFHVRKAFVMSCRELCPVLGEEDSEEHLLPLFMKLCKDEVWGVRKACADVFTDVSASCNLGTRHDKLTPVYLSLLHDDSRWVRKAAFQSLGAFISTFYIPNGGGSPDLEDSQLPPLPDSVLMDNSLLEDMDLSTSIGMATAGPSVGTATTDPSEDTRHTGESEQSSTLQEKSAESNKDIDFVPREISRTSSEESLEKSLQEMSVEDIEQDSASFTKGHDLNDILDSAIMKIDVQPALTLDEQMIVNPPPIKAVKLGSEEEVGVVKERFETTSESTESSVNPSDSSPTGNGSSHSSETPVTTAQTSSEPDKPVEPKHSRLSELLMEDNSRIRSSSEGSSFRSYFDPVMRDEVGGKKRRWSLDKNNTTSQVRVFIHSTSGKVTEQDLSVVDQEPLTPDTPSGNFDMTTTNSLAMDITLDGVESVPSDPNLITEAPGQEVVPDELMESYLSMTEQAKAQVVDTDLPYYCAYSLPGVALTLGQEHWELIKPTFTLLAGDMQWRIRRVLSFCLHELAKVVGEERMCSDILPVFEEYCTKDIDDVKIGALSHLAEFFELLPTGLRSCHLPGVLNGLQDVENEKNWRYRNLLAEQIVLLCDLFECDYLEQHVYPVALTLAEDKVSEVRSTATLALGVILQKLSQIDMEKCRSILQQLRAYGSNEKWLYRLMYVKQCETFLLDGRISCELFASECLPILLQLARDKVPNVRIAVAKMLKDSVLKIDYFQTENKETFSLEELQITLECLQHDQDRDVKFFAGGEITNTRRLVMLPVQWYTQRHRSESLQSHSSSDLDQYQDALEHQPQLVEEPHPPDDVSCPPEEAPRPLSLTMAGVLVNSLQKSPTYAGDGKALSLETTATSLNTNESSQGTQDRENQNTNETSQDTSEEQQASTLDTSGGFTMESRETTKASHETGIDPPDTIEESPETAKECQDTIAEPQDTTVESENTSVDSQDTISESQDTRENVNSEIERDSPSDQVESSKPENTEVADQDIAQDTTQDTTPESSTIEGDHQSD